MDSETKKEYDNTRKEFDQLIFELMSELDKTKCDESKVQRLLGAAHYLHQKLNEIYYRWKYTYEMRK